MEIPARLRQARSALLLIFLVHGAAFALLVTRIPALQDRYALSDAALPMFLAAVPVLAGAGSVTASRLVRRLPAPALVRILQPAIFLTLVGIGGGTALWQLALCLTLFGLLVGAMEATVNMTGVGIQRRYGRSIMLGFHAAASLGGILGAVLAWAGATTDLSLLTLFAGSVALLLPAAMAAGPFLSRGYDAGGPVPGEPAGTAAVRPVPGRGTPWKPLLPLCMVMAVSVVADSTATNWSAKFLEDTLHSSEAMATVPYALYMAATLLGRGFGDGWVERWGAPAVVRTGALLAAAGCAAVAAAPEPWTGVLGFALLGAGLSVILPQVFAAGAQRLPGAADTAVARINLFNYVGFLVGPPLIGAVGAGISFRVALCVPLVLVLCVLPAARSLAAPAPPAPAPAPKNPAPPAPVSPASAPAPTEPAAPVPAPATGATATAPPRSETAPAAASAPATGASTTPTSTG
ncbi:MFS transporter [Streptomyces sp. NPDC057245]|uniref:MFS transporter n=1 Tax=Streptomyces sp. NPDC057245 TaxID=3346065 RepID=UPI003626A040